jgi:hypothetical protein
MQEISRRADAMSALTMILTAAMVVPGDGSGQEKASMEMAQVVDLSGDWEGTGQSAMESKWRIKFSRGRVRIQSQQGTIEAPFKIIGEGEGKLRMEVSGAGAVWKLLGIYKWQGNRLVICCREESKGRPTSFAVDDVNRLLILHRLKPCK